MFANELDLFKTWSCYPLNMLKKIYCTILNSSNAMVLISTYQTLTLFNVNDNILST